MLPICFRKGRNLEFQCMVLWMRLIRKLKHLPNPQKLCLNSVLKLVSLWAHSNLLIFKRLIIYLAWLMYSIILGIYFINMNGLIIDLVQLFAWACFISISFSCILHLFFLALMNNLEVNHVSENIGKAYWRE
jgi:hypothetical protein